MCEISRKEVAWRQGGRGKKRRGRADERKKLRVIVWHGIQETPCVKLWAPCSSGCGRVRSRNTYFGHVLIAVRQGRQRRDAAAAGEEQLGRCAAEQSKYLAPHTSGPRDVPRCGALGLLQKTPHYRGDPAETAATLNVKLCVLVTASLRGILPLFSPNPLVE